MTYDVTTNLGLRKTTGGAGVDWYNDTLYNWDILDETSSPKHNDDAAIDPTANDDASAGYAENSLWNNKTGGRQFICKDPTTANAVWNQFYPPLAASISGNVAADTLDTHHSSYFATRIVPAADANLAQLDLSTGDLEDSGVKVSELSRRATAPTAGHLAGVDADGDVTDSSKTTPTGDVVGTSDTQTLSGKTVSDALKLDLSASFKKITTPSNPASGYLKLYPKADGYFYGLTEGGIETQIGGGISFWQTLPGNPVRTGDNTFTITDSANENYYDIRFSPGTILQWQKSGGGDQYARIVSAVYGANIVTYTIIGNTLSTGFTAMKYCIHRARRYTFVVPGSMPGNTATTDINGQHFVPDNNILIFDARTIYGTGPTTTNGVWDINDDAASIFTTKLVATASQTIGVDTVCNCLLATALTAVAKDSIVTLDYDSGHATTPGSDAQVDVWYMPEAWRYM